MRLPFSTLNVYTGDTQHENTSCAITSRTIQRIES